MGELAYLIELTPDLARAVLHPDVYALGIEIVEAKRELADPESRVACLEYLFFGMQMHMPDVVIEALDAKLGRGHDRIAFVPASELRAVGEDESTPIALLPNGDPNFFYRPTLKIPTNPMSCAAEPCEYQKGLPLITEEELRRLFLAHKRALNERTVQEINKAFRKLRATWRQGDGDRVDAFIRELGVKGIGPRDGERLAQKRGLKLSRSTISRRLRRL
jgi:hypothetical protein